MDKKISPKEAALAVLKKAEEMLKSSKLEKGYREDTHRTSAQGDVVRAVNAHKKATGNPGKEGMEQAKGMAANRINKLANESKPNLPKSEEGMAAMPGMEMSEEQPAAHNPKGIHKLAKFMGHRDEKKKSQVVPAEKDMSAPMEKGQNDGKHANNHAYNFDDMQAQKGVNKVLPHYDRKTGKLGHGGSEAHWGGKAKPETQKRVHKETLNELKSMPKPNLPKGGK
jgi:hypothetical protein